MRMENDLHALAGFHDLEGLVDFGQWEAVGDDGFGADPAAFEEFHGHGVLARGAAVRPGDEAFFVVDGVGEDG